MRTTVTVFCALLLFVTACKKGTSKGARLAKERLQPHIAELDGVAPASVEISMDEEVFRNVWFARAHAKTDWRCFVDVFAIFCDRGEGKIFSDLVAHRRLGDNRASVDDPAWVQMLRLAHGFKSVYPDKDFPLTVDKSKLQMPRVERPPAGGVQITIYALDKDDHVLRVEADVVGEGTVTVRKLPVL
jgi:hypothetical protein